MSRPSFWKLEATYAGTPRGGHHLLLDVSGDMNRDHMWVNSKRGGWPPGVPTGARVRFTARPLYRYSGTKITDVRDVEVIQ